MRLYGPGVCGGHEATVTTMCQVGPYNGRITTAVVVLKGACLIVGDGCAAVTLSIALVGYRHGRFDQWHRLPRAIAGQWPTAEVRYDFERSRR
jgi:hypothetical protein